MVRVSLLAAFVIFLTFFGAGLLMVVSFLVVGGLGSMIPFADGFSIVLSLLLILSLTKRFLLSVGVQEGDARKLALLIGFLSVLVFYMTVPVACWWCR